jgi:toxin ParE1/3/4
VAQPGERRSRSNRKRIARDSPTKAQQLLARILSKIDLLSAYPYLGHAGERAGTRELVVHTHYIVIYRLSEKGIEVLQVKHAARLRH